jgi:hypothetical protein
LKNGLKEKNKMEVTYMYDDMWEENLQELIERLVSQDTAREDIIGLKIDLCELEPFCDSKIDYEDFRDVLNIKYEERTDEDENALDKMETVFKRCIDFDKLNEELSKIKLYYPSGKTYTILESDLEGVEFD